MKASLTPLKTLLIKARTKQYSEGQLIFYAGDEVTETLVLTAGIVKVYDIDAKGQEKILQIIKSPAILPLDCLFAASHPIGWHYAALTDIEASAFSPSELYSEMRTSPDLSTYILNWLAVESHELLVRINGMSKSDVKNKIITLLRFLTVYYSGPLKRGWRRIEFPVTHQLIADITGVTRESISIQMGHLQKDKIVRPRRPFLEIHDERLAHFESIE